MISLVHMPFGSHTRPALALGLIKAQLSDAGMPARVHYLNLDFAQRIGFSAYEALALFKGVDIPVGEWLFSREAFGREPGPSEHEFLRRFGDKIRSIHKVPDPAAWLLDIRRRIVRPYLERCAERLFSGDPPRVVAFSCMFFQTVPALALGRLIKERRPEVKLAYGGASFHDEMGEELIRKVPWIDAVSTGEADDVIVPLFRALRAGRTPALLQGVLARDERGGIVEGLPHRPASSEVLEALPDPDFDEFFEDAARYRLPDAPSWQERVALSFEASRGCWWGQKRHCTFCGLNREGMTFRVKSAERALGTMRRLAARYTFRHLQAADNILAMGYWKTLLPRLAEERLESAGRPVSIFFEVKPNLSRAQIKAMADAGVAHVQPGIESLSTHLLELMAKGVTGLQNVFLLKCCAEYGIAPLWNLLIRVPGERIEDYQQMERWVPLLAHLRPPSSSTSRIELHRFSPYHFQRGVYTEDVRAAAWYAGLFPEDQVDLLKVAYYFEATWKDTLGDPAYEGVQARIAAWIRSWRRPSGLPRLSMRETRNTEGRGLLIEDARGDAPARFALGPLEAAVYRAVSDIATPRGVREALLAEGVAAPDEGGIRARLLAFVEQGLALAEGDRFLGLALPAAGDPPA
jgi:ribosomal peptide maturation radical SAM protein 1